MGKLVGYARVSGDDQNLNMQIDALLGAGVKRQYLFMDQVSGAKTERPGLAECINSWRPRFSTSVAFGSSWALDATSCDGSRGFMAKRCGLQVAL